MDAIPKIIHYVWFGGKEFPPLIESCVQSWEKHLPEYQIIRWDETNFNLNINAYVSESYHAHMYAFTSDYVRLYALYQYGGVYLDTDVEITQSLNPFLKDCAFSGFETKDTVPTAVMGAHPEHPLIGDLLNQYNDRSFVNADGEYDLTTNVITITRFLLDNGLTLNGKKQTVKDLVLYPQAIFCPHTFGLVFNKYPKEAYAVHHFYSSWKHKKLNRSTFFFRLYHYLIMVLRNLIGTNNCLTLYQKISKLKRVLSGLFQ